MEPFGALTHTALEPFGAGYLNSPPKTLVSNGENGPASRNKRPPPIRALGTVPLPSQKACRAYFPPSPDFAMTITDFHRTVPGLCVPQAMRRFDYRVPKSIGWPRKVKPSCRKTNSRPLRKTQAPNVKNSVTFNLPVDNRVCFGIELIQKGNSVSAHAIPPDCSALFTIQSLGVPVCDCCGYFDSSLWPIEAHVCP